jgi:glycosyltransferase involved in cell wall biosynthesis
MLSTQEMRKRILFIVHLPPPVHGAAMMGQYLKESKLINSSFEADYINLTTASGLDGVGRASTRKIMTILQLNYRVFKAMQKKRYDLYYVSLNSHGPGFYKDFLVVFLLKIFGKKVVYHFHNKGVVTQQHKPVANMLYKFTFRNTRSILLSRLLYSDVAKYVKEENVYYCANGIPEVGGNFRVQRRDTEMHTCRLLFLSNMYIAKGVYELIEASKILRQKQLSFECHFVGAWSELSEEVVKEKIKRHGLSDMVYFHGKKIGRDKFAHFQNAEIFVSPSHNECFPLVNLEAMQFALPVVTTAVGGNPDIVVDGETGYLVPPKDVAALAEKLELLIRNHSLRKNMGLAGRKRYETCFTLDKFETNMKVALEAAMKN